VRETFQILSALAGSLLLFLSCSDDNSTGSTEREPTVTTAPITRITSFTAGSGGEVTSDGGEAVTARGICWGTNDPPTINDNKTTDGAGTGDFASSLSGLTGATTYYVRAYATNWVGTGYGNTRFLTTPATLSDIDNNEYATVVIGSQTWMAENLKVTRFRNGDFLPLVTDGSTWEGLTAAAFCEYNNNAASVATYGRLYNWYAVSDDRNIAPTGWHVPTDAEWQMLVDYLGGWETAGTKMKEAGFTHWASPNTGATNESGFSALPAGQRRNGTYQHKDSCAYFWTSTQDSYVTAPYWFLAFDNVGAYRDVDPNQEGFSVRCIKDQPTP